MPRISDGNGTDPVFVGPAAGKKKRCSSVVDLGGVLFGGFHRLISWKTNISMISHKN